MTPDLLRGLKPRLWLAAIFAGALFADFGSGIRAEDVAKEDAKPATDGGKAPSKAVSLAEQLEFLQAKVSAEMAELEQRMFHLSETLKPLEPENASRLMLGVKFAREELIVHQMKQIQTQLRSASLAESVIEQKQLLAKLERLEQLLLSADLDFQMRLERLRQIRAVLQRLDGVIREEQRERQQSEQAAAKAAQAKAAERRTSEIEKLIERETAHLVDLGRLTDGSAKPEPAADDAPPKSPREALLGQQGETRAATAELAETEAKATGDPPAPIGQALAEAGSQMQSAEEKLGGEKPAAAQPAMQAALAALQKAREQSQAETKRLRDELDAERFAAMAKDQSANRKSTESISEMVRGLGSSGAKRTGRVGQGRRQHVESRVRSDGSPG